MRVDVGLPGDVAAVLAALIDRLGDEIGVADAAKCTMLGICKPTLYSYVRSAEGKSAA